MANSLSINSCSSSLRPLIRSSNILPATTSRRTAFTAPPCRLHRPLILSEMQSAISVSPSATTNEDAGHNSLAQTTSINTQRLNLQMLPLANIPPWAKLVLGSVVLLSIPFFKKAIRIQDLIKAMETTAETVEMVAEATEKVALEFAEVLPNGRLKEAALKLEKIALVVDKSAEVTESVIDKVEDVVKVLDTALKPVINGENKLNSADEDKEMMSFTFTTSELKEEGLH